MISKILAPALISVTTILGQDSETNFPPENPSGSGTQQQPTLALKLQHTKIQKSKVRALKSILRRN